jgi:hypothetical protein
MLHAPPHRGDPGSAPTHLRQHPAADDDERYSGRSGSQTPGLAEDRGALPAIRGAGRYPARGVYAGGPHGVQRRGCLGLWRASARSRAETRSSSGSSMDSNRGSCPLLRRKRSRELAVIGRLPPRRPSSGESYVHPQVRPVGAVVVAFALIHAPWRDAVEERAGDHVESHSAHRFTAPSMQMTRPPISSNMSRLRTPWCARQKATMSASETSWQPDKATNEAAAQAIQNARLMPRAQQEEKSWWDAHTKGTPASSPSTRSPHTSRTSGLRGPLPPAPGRRRRDQPRRGLRHQ